jgi:putative ABC transport system ATP-binding protein
VAQASSASEPHGSGSVAPLFELRALELERAGRPVLRQLTLDLPRVAITGIVGPSGAGKTSLLRLLNRLDEPTSGEIRFEGKPLTGYPVRALRRRVGFVFQRAAMFTGTIADNLRAAVEIGGPEAARLAPDMEAVLRAVGLGPECATRDAEELSGGEQQRVSIGRALMTRPELLLLDEPTASLDPETAQLLLSTIARLAAEHQLCILMITHRLSEARRFTTHTVMLEAGRVVESGATQQLFTAAKTERARTYLASADEGGARV